MTKKIYELDPYMTECIATVKNQKQINDQTWISLDQTIFYPEGGGQPFDLGYIDTVLVEDVQIIEQDIYHKVSEPIEKSRVRLTIDAKRRFDHMQQHTGQHLLSAVWKELFNIETVSFHLGADICTIDLQTNMITNEQVAEVEEKIAHYIFENRTIESYILPYDEVEEEKLKKLTENPQYVRFVHIEGIDESTCCGTHVSALGELGVIKIIGFEKYKQMTRLKFLCGSRAFHYFQQTFSSLTEVSKKLNVSPIDVNERFPIFYEGYQILKKKYQDLYEKAIYFEANEILETMTEDYIELIWDERSLQEMKDLAKIIIEKGNKVVALHSIKTNTWIFAATTSSLFNVTTCIQYLKEHFGGKGGGSSVFGQWVGELELSKWNEIKKFLFM